MCKIFDTIQFGEIEILEITLQWAKSYGNHSVCQDTLEIFNKYLNIEFTTPNELNQLFQKIDNYKLLVDAPSVMKMLIKQDDTSTKNLANENKTTLIDNWLIISSWKRKSFVKCTCSRIVTTRIAKENYDHVNIIYFFYFKRY